MAKNQNNNVAPATKKTGAEAKKDALATALAQIIFCCMYPCASPLSMA